MNTRQRTLYLPDEMTSPARAITPSNRKHKHKTMNKPTITRARPLLPNSDSRILQPIETPNGTLQVVWVPDIDAHCLFYARDGDASILASHNNGYSCRALAERLVKGEWKPIRDQIEYIRDCGGMATAERFFESFLPKIPACEAPDDSRQSQLIKCATCGRLIHFQSGEVYKNGESYVCRLHA